MNEKLRKYIKEIDGISHITLDPKGPGVVRIHLIPPKRIKPNIAWIVLLNGSYILPIGFSWAILLREFINEATKDSNVINDVGIEDIINKVSGKIVEVFGKNTKEDMVVRDMKEIISTFIAICKGDTVGGIAFMRLKDYARYMSSPHRMDLMISSMKKDGSFNCNQRCIHCYAGSQTEANTKELSTDEWIRIIEKLKEARIPQITFTGGEPTLRDDLAQLVKKSEWFITRLNTNGVLLNDSLCKELYEASLDSVQITLYSSDEAIHNILVGTSHFKDTIEGIKNAIKNKLNVSINTPLCTLNRDYAKLVKYCHEELGISYFTCSGLIISGNAVKSRSRETRLASNELLDELIKALAYARENECDIQFTSPGWIDEKILRSLNINIPSCGAALSNMAIAPNGDCVPCQSWLSDEPLGNILELDWKKIWNNKKTKKIRHNSCNVDYKCPLMTKNMDSNVLYTVDKNDY